MKMAFLVLHSPDCAVPRIRMVSAFGLQVGCISLRTLWVVRNGLPAAVHRAIEQSGEEYRITLPVAVALSRSVDGTFGR